MINISVFLILYSVLIVVDGSDTPYPTNSQEIEFINSATSVLKSSTQDLIRSVSQSIEANLKLLKSFDGSDKRSIELLEEYLSLAAISQENCNLYHAEKLVFLLHLHQFDPESNSFKFIKETATEQFKLCLPIWDKQFAAAIYSINESDRNKMDRLLDQMMQIKFKNEDQVSKPYNGAQLRRLIANLPASAILLFMVSLDPREQMIPVDENMKNLSFGWERFQKVYANLVLSLCTNVCNSLESTSKVFKPAFDYNLESSQYAGVNHLRDQWIASRMICCSIKRSYERMTKTGQDIFMKSTFDKLTIQEEIMIENELGLDELIAFGDTLSDS